MKCSTERLIEALIGVELAQERKAAEQKAAVARKASLVVTVSRGYGSLGKQTAEALADRLGVNCCDRDILEGVARRADVDLELVAKLDENVRRSGARPWKALIKGDSFKEEHYLRHLVTVIMNIANKGGVIVGRGAHLVLGPEKAFRVRIVGSLERCAARIAERDQLDLDSARQRVQAVDNERAEYLRKLYDVDIKDCSDFDLVINSDRFSVQQMVDLILGAMRQVGYEIDADSLQPA